MPTFDDRSGVEPRLGSLRRTLHELGALPDSPARATDGRRDWLRDARRTIEALEKVCCTIVLCCARIVRAAKTPCETATCATVETAGD